MTNAELLADILASIRIRSSGRTRYEGQSPYEDETLLDEIERQQSALAQSALERAGLVEALNEVMEWISGWSPNFEADDEWPATKARVDKALSALSSPGTKDTNDGA